MNTRCAGRRHRPAETVQLQAVAGQYVERLCSASVRSSLTGKKGTADLQSPAPYYTPFTYVGAHWHRWHVRPIDPSGFRGPKEFDERETKEKYVVPLLNSIVHVITNHVGMCAQPANVRVATFMLRARHQSGRAISWRDRPGMTNGTWNERHRATGQISLTLPGSRCCGAPRSSMMRTCRSGGRTASGQWVSIFHLSSSSQGMPFSI